MVLVLILFLVLMLLQIINFEEGGRHGEQQIPHSFCDWPESIALLSELMEISQRDPAGISRADIPHVYFCFHGIRDFSF